MREIAHGEAQAWCRGWLIKTLHMSRFALTLGRHIGTDFPNYFDCQVHRFLFRKIVVLGSDLLVEPGKILQGLPMTLLPLQLLELPEPIYGHQRDLWAAADLNQDSVVRVDHLTHQRP